MSLQLYIFKHLGYLIFSASRYESFTRVKMHNCIRNLWKIVYLLGHRLELEPTMIGLLYKPARQLSEF